MNWPFSFGSDLGVAEPINLKLSPSIETAKSTLVGAKIQALLY
jgi:hypothetical protein